MATSLSKAEQNALAVSYDVLGTHVDLDLAFVKNYLVRGRSELVSDQEAVFFMNLCKMQKLNPLTGGEVYLIKYSKEQPAQYVVGKTTYMRRLYEHPDYLCKEDGITVQRGDTITQKEGCCMYPGETLIGGWCRIHFMRNGKERAAFKEVSLAEYSSGMANWKTKPATMVNKVAVSQCAREAFPKDYEGLYSEEEMVASGAIPTSCVDVVVDDAGNAVDAEDRKLITQGQRQEFMDKISGSFEGKDAKNETYRKILIDLGLKSMNNMTVGEWKKAMDLVGKYAEEGEKTEDESSADTEGIREETDADAGE